IYVKRNTYTNRIKELKGLHPQQSKEGKALPARPESHEYKSEDSRSPVGEEDDAVVIETATMARIVNDSYPQNPIQSRSLPASQLPPRRESLLPSAMDS